MGSDYGTSGALTPQNALNLFQRYLPQLQNLVASGGTTSGTSQLNATNALYNTADPAAYRAYQDALAKYNAASVKYNQPGHSAADSVAYKQAQQDFNAAQSAYNNALPKPQGLNELNANQFAQWMPGLSQTAQGIVGSNLNAAAAANRAANPNYYLAQDAASRGASEAVNAINLKGLSPGEFAATERAQNQTNTGTGNAGLVNNTNTIANAMNFGGAFNNKIGLMNAASGNAANVAQSANNSNMYGVANTTNALASSMFQPATVGAGVAASGNNFGLGSSLLSGVTGLNSSANAAGAAMSGQSSPLAWMNGVTGGMNGAMSSY